MTAQEVEYEQQDLTLPTRQSFQPPPAPRLKPACRESEFPQLVLPPSILDLDEFAVEDWVCGEEGLDIFRRASCRADGGSVENTVFIPGNPAGGLSGASPLLAIALVQLQKNGGV
eukprot:TRINITY_DN70829_c0_g1_i1.p2 TRINITY_DN70829_c0_g1~~TRINITY_DN70829_c0_g1_i1.p2  ORF type:complete len:115 (+),score=21.20 TRINITY_DN70829_c0_g1_i1:173-517(+)